MASPDDEARSPERKEKMRMVWTKQCLMLAREKLPDDTYKEFIKTMAEMRKQSADPDGEIRNISPAICIPTVMRLLQGHPQVKLAFLNFIKGRCPLDCNANAIDLELQKSLDFMKRVKRCPDISTADYHVLVKILLAFSRSMTLNAEGVYHKAKKCFINSPELLEEFQQNYLPPGLVALLSNEQYCRNPGAHPNLDGIRVKANTRTKEELLVAEEYEGDKVEPLPDSREKELPPKINLSICRRSTPSYCLLPKNCTTLQSSYQTELGKSVLNDGFVSVTSGSEDQDRFKKKQTESGIDGDQDRKSGTKNKYEKVIFRAENDMFESDLVLEWFRATADFIATLKDRGVNDMKIQDHLTPIHRRCIERLYGNHGLDMLDALLEAENPSAALAILLSRLNQKIEDLSEARSSLHKTCSGIIAKNYYRSLDRRSASFKQLDIKRMSQKALLTEANEINKTNLNAGNKYTDPDMHEDICSIISWACASEDTQMMTWTNLVQHFLSVNCLWPDLKETGVPKEACEHCGISKDFLSSMPNDLSANTSKRCELPRNKFGECSSMHCPGDGLSIATDTSGPCTCDNGNEPEEQHEPEQDSKRSVKPRGVKGETCCSLVVLRRLYEILHERLQVAKRLSRDSCNRDLYEEFKEKLRRLLDRSVDNCNFENFCLKFLGSESFELFTLDRLISRVIKQIRIIFSSDQDNTLLQFLEKLHGPILPKNISQLQNASPM